MSSGLAVYQLTELVSEWVDDRRWVWVGSSAAALTAIPTLALLSGLLGLGRRLRWLHRLAGPYFASAAAVGLAPLVAPPLAWLYDDGLWGLAMLAGLVVCFTPIVVASMRRVLRSRGAERARAQLVASAFVLGIGSVITDLLAMGGLEIPRLSSVGLVLAAAVVAALTLEARLVTGVRPVALLNAVLVALFAVGLQVIVVTWAGDRSVLVAFGSVVVALVFVVGLAPLYASHAEQRARTEELLTLGRFARQFAHDVRNPLAAIKGAGQFLEAELAEGRPLEAHADMLRTIVEQVDRVERTLSDHQRYARIQPELVPLELAPLVDRALDAVGAAAPRIELARDFDPRCSRIEADADLLAYALENVLRNAYEAMPDGGRVTVRSALTAGKAPRMELSVEDDGPGIDPSLVDRMLEGHYSTKPGGSGLGLAFVRRVVEAHGGALRVESELGRGARVVLSLPARANLSAG
jgi:two-component system, NtrC family, sensor histidine kinase HydH